jgi:hypothetical protein
MSDTKKNPQQNPQLQDGEVEREEWNPTQAQLHEYFAHETELARSNVRMVLTNFGRRGMSFKEIRECMLHSADTVGDSLDMEVAAGRIKSEEGRYFLN